MLEERAAAHSTGQRRRARRRRLLVGLGAAVLLSGAAGYVVGLQSHTTASDITAQYDAARSPQASELSSEVNRTLLELWRMEDVEAVRNSGRSR
ncbi:MAG: hypothetical protein RJQ04_14950 [Longimicrobiales bacterium]